jgi:hypothetical protein
MLRPIRRRKSLATLLWHTRKTLAHRPFRAQNKLGYQGPSQEQRQDYGTQVMGTQEKLGQHRSYLGTQEKQR